MIGTILATGPRTVAAALRVLGLSTDADFQTYHRVLNRARWCSRTLSHTLLLLLVQALVTVGAPIVVGLDETIERRRGARIAAKGIYRDPVRSSKGHFVKASGLRWVSMQLLAPTPWARRVWALPFLTVLAPSERYALDRGLRHKTLPDWGRPMLRQLWSAVSSGQSPSIRCPRYRPTSSKFPAPSGTVLPTSSPSPPEMDKA